LFLDASIVVGVLCAGAILMMPRLARARIWRATVTPLASIIGSGFLVIGPILDTSYGGFAPLAMMALCGGAYLYGSAIRFNIRILEQERGPRRRLEAELEIFASWSLAFAYVISVAYYLNLFGAFALRLTPLSGALYPRLLTSSMLLVIGIVGWRRGFEALERMEQLTVSLKLAIIAGLLIGLTEFFLYSASHDALYFNPPEQTGWNGLALAFGLLITVQGFETSRYLAEDHDAQERVRSMRLAQWISTAIYMIYIGLISYVFRPNQTSLSETAIIDMTSLVSPILPVILVGAALSAQFSAAVADTSASGGLVAELTRGRVSSRQGYALLVVVGFVLTWTSNVFDIISYASRAFAVYYALQAAIASAAALRRPDHRHVRGPLYGLLVVLGLLIVAFGVPAEH